MDHDIEYYYSLGNEMSGGKRDYYPAICRAQEATEVADRPRDPSVRKGFRLDFAAQEYFFSKPIELVRCMHLRGSGGDPSGTIFTFPKDSPGIIVHSTASHGNRLYVDLSKLGGYAFTPAVGETYPFSGATITVLDNGVPVTLRETYQGAAGSIIEGLYLRCDEPSSPLGSQSEFVYSADYGTAYLINPYETSYAPDKRAHGISAFGLVSIRNVMVDGFFCHGIYFFGHGGARPSGSISGDSTSGLAQVSSHADCSTVEESTIIGNGGDGIHMFGGDAAYCRVSNINDNNNGGWAIADLSRLGNVMMNCNTNAQTRELGGAGDNPRLFISGGFLRPNKVVLPLCEDAAHVKDVISLFYRNVVDAVGSIIDVTRYNTYASEILATRDYATQGRSVFINCYTDGAISYIAASNIVIGGYARAFGTPNYIDVGQTLLFPNGLAAYGFQDLLDPPDDVPARDFAVTRLGGNNNAFPNLSIELDHGNTSEVASGTRRMYRLLFQQEEAGWWELTSIDSGGGNKTPLRLSTASSDIGDNGQIWFENGFYVGEKADGNRIKVVSGSRAPMAGSWNIGDRVLNCDPDASDTNADPLVNKSCAGWINTRTGWRPFGKIQ